MPILCLLQALLRALFFPEHNNVSGNLALTFQSGPQCPLLPSTEQTSSRGALAVGKTGCAWEASPNSALSSQPTWPLKAGWFPVLSQSRFASALTSPVSVSRCSDSANALRDESSRQSSLTLEGFFLLLNLVPLDFFVSIAF